MTVTWVPLYSVGRPPSRLCVFRQSRGNRIGNVVRLDWSSLQQALASLF